MSIKKIIGILVILSLFYIGFTKITANAEPNSLLVSKGNLNPVDSDLLLILLELRSVKLDGGIFLEDVFLSLKDFSTKIQEQPVGRNNPFSKIGVGGTYIDTSKVE